MLSLDAPAVAVLWQSLIAHVAGGPLRWHHRFVLGTSVWLAYAADRWIEGWRLAPGQVRTQRHFFYQRARWPIALLWLAILVTAVGTARQFLTRHEFLAGLLLLLPVLVYLLSHQLAHRTHRWRAPKELCVATLLTGGVALFPCTQPGAALQPALVALGLFALLCFTNCVLISTWEREVDAMHGQTSLALQFDRASRHSRLLPWIAAIAAGIIALTLKQPYRIAALCAMGSALLLGAVDLVERRSGWQLARVLADAVLLTPLIPLLAGLWS